MKSVTSIYIVHFRKYCYLDMKGLCETVTGFCILVPTHKTQPLLVYKKYIEVTLCHFSFIVIYVRK